MKAKRKLTLSITLVAALLMALLTAGTVLAAEGDEITIAGSVLEINEEEGTLLIDVDGDETTLEDQFIVYVGANFKFDSVAVGDLIEVTGIEGEDGSITVTELKIQERIKDQIKSQDGEGDAYFCAIDTDKAHPIAEKIALTYGLPYETILGLLCAENPVSLGQIMLALQTAALTGEDFTTYLTGDMDEFHWGQIWQEFDIKGKPDKGIPPGEIQKGEKSEEGEGNDNQGQKNKDGEEGECDTLLCGVYKWYQTKKGNK
ncbi:MAG: hypothetical protein KAU23_11110 [Anaerolineales bacterium]|nr:hypothetical protein [Anaerolineales bacterium]